MLRFFLLLALTTLLVSDVFGQNLVPVTGILSNSVTNLHADGETIWVGPHLNVSQDQGQTWNAVNTDSLSGLKNRVYSIDIEGNVIWVGLGDKYDRTSNGGRTQEIHRITGLLNSNDHGFTWRYVPYFPVEGDDPNTTGLLDSPDDTLITYGRNQLSALAVTVPDLSPPWDIDYDPNNREIWVAAAVAGLRKSSDNGYSWQRIVLPPDTSEYISPDLNYVFPFFSLPEPAGIPVRQFRGYNFGVFSVLVDEIGTIWTGTQGGLNKSDDGGISWRHITTRDGLLGNTVFSIEEQTRPGLPPAIWVTNRAGSLYPDEIEASGVSVTHDHGKTFENLLHGLQCFDFAFDERMIYVACDEGLFISKDNGATFISNSIFPDDQSGITSRRKLRVHSVALTNGVIWAGTEDGLFQSRDGGNSWNSFRANVPLNPEGLPPMVPVDLVPSVSTYAYPNPFSPIADQLIRFKYDLKESGSVTIRVFDFGMNLVRTVVSEIQEQGTREVSWDGIDDYGARLANGPYFYAVQTQGETFWGKILIVN
ncbi:MAG: hypothetical protein F4100_03265 [Rhodothermaceae bacterium]|nr:hypothetical protein [Rhodothermaceae bacterium]MYE63850.1 hypothetical protein [Rhodothermaceae bacterium]MYJ19756.1 hypothetical protein [Rhodothermaceae bacterium]